MVYVCKARNGKEIYGFEMHPKSIVELLEILESYKEAHIQATDKEIEFDLWVNVK